MALSLDQQKLIGIYREVAKQELGNGVQIKLRIIGKSLDSQIDDIIRFAKNERIPDLEETLIHNEERKIAIINEIDTINAAIADWGNRSK